MKNHINSARTGTVGKVRQVALWFVAMVCVMLPQAAVAKTTIGTTDSDAQLKDAITLRLTQDGLDYIADILEAGLEAENLRRDIVNALEGQVFEVLVPQLGGYAVITVDYGEGSPYEELDGFRYDDVSVILSSIPQAPRVPPEAGVVYPALYLNEYQDNSLPQLHVYLNYEPFISAATPISAVVEATLVTSGILRPSFGEGTIRVAVEDFETNVFQMQIAAWGDFPPGLTEQEETLKEVLGEAILEGARKEVNDALSGVFIDGLNDILFDRDKNGTPDDLLNIGDIIDEVNKSFDTQFDYAIEPRFQSNPVEPPEILMGFDTAFFSQTDGACAGRDLYDGMRYTLLEGDGDAGHDPPQIPYELDSEAPYQLALSVSDDFLNSIIQGVYRTGKLCLSLDPTSDAIPDEFRNLLNTATFSALAEGEWLYEAAPDAPLRFDIVPTEAPYIQIYPDGSADTFGLVMPSVALNVYVQIHDTWRRIIGYDANLTLDIDWQDLQLAEGNLIDLNASIDAKTEPVFDKWVSDADPEQVRALFPLLLSIAGSSVGDLVGSIQLDAAECIQGVDIGLFELGTDGDEPDANLSHYLQMFVAFEGIPDLGFLLTQCFLDGDTLAAPRFEGRQMVVTDALALGPYAPLRYRVNGGPINPWRGSLAKDHFWGGVNALDIYDGRSWERVHVIRDETPPRLSQDGASILIAEPTAPEQIQWQQFNARGEVVDQGSTTEARLHPEATYIVAHNAAGLNARLDVSQPAGGFGCNASGGNQSAAVLGWMLLAVIGFNRRRRQLQDLQ